MPDPRRTVRPELFFDDSLDARAGPARHREQPLHIGERAQPALKRRLKFFRGVGLGQSQHGLDDGEQIVRSMIDFSGQQHHSLFGLLAGGDVHQHVDGAEQPAGLVAKRGRIGHEADARAVGAFGNRLHIPDRAVFLERDRHRTIFMGKRRAVRREQLPGHAPHVADLRRAAGELDAGAIEERDPAIGIGRVDGGRQRLQQIAELFFLGILARPRSRCA